MMCGVFHSDWTTFWIFYGEGVAYRGCVCGISFWLDNFLNIIRAREWLTEVVFSSSFRLLLVSFRCAQLKICWTMMFSAHK